MRHYGSQQKHARSKIGSKCEKYHSELALSDLANKPRKDDFQ